MANRREKKGEIPMSMCHQNGSIRDRRTLSGNSHSMQLTNGRYTVFNVEDIIVVPKCIYKSNFGYATKMGKMGRTYCVCVLAQVCIAIWNMPKNREMVKRENANNEH